MKSHKTLKITRKLLGQFRACGDGLRAVAPLLPATISTKTLDNLELAAQLVETGAAHYVDWFSDRCNGSMTNLVHPDVDYSMKGGEYDTFRSSFDDPYVVAQWLAHAADRYFTRKGR